MVSTSNARPRRNLATGVVPPSPKRNASQNPKRSGRSRGFDEPRRKMKARARTGSGSTRTQSSRRARAGWHGGAGERSSKRGVGPDTRFAEAKEECDCQSPCLRCRCAPPEAKTGTLRFPAVAEALMISYARALRCRKSAACLGPRTVVRWDYSGLPVLLHDLGYKSSRARFGTQLQFPAGQSMPLHRLQRSFPRDMLASAQGGTDAAQVFAVSLSQTRPKRNGVRRVTHSVRRNSNVRPHHRARFVH
jgi:hypothetical protein